MKMVSTWAGSVRGQLDGVGTEAQFEWCNGMEFHANGNLYIAVSHGVRTVTPEAYVSYLTGSGNGGFNDGSFASALFNNPIDLAIDASGDIYVAERTTHRVRKVYMPQ